MVRMSWYLALPTTEASAHVIWSLIHTVTSAARTKNTPAHPRYCAPMRLWSTDTIQPTTLPRCQEEGVGVVVLLIAGSGSDWVGSKGMSFWVYEKTAPAETARPPPRRCRAPVRRV